MSLLTSRGSAAIESAAKSNVDLEKVMIRLKDGDSIKVRLLTSEDFAEYSSIGEFNLGIFTQPSREPLGEKDYFVEAGKLANAKDSEIDEKFKRLYSKPRYLIAMADVGSGLLRFWDASKPQFNTFVAGLEEYKDIIDDGEEIVFNFKRTGDKTETTYTLQPIMRPKDEDLEGFHKFDGVTVEDADFVSVLMPRTPEMQVGILKEAGFPVEKYFPEITLEDSEKTESSDSGEVSALEDI